MYWSKATDVIAFGTANLLNHSNDSNVRLTRDRKRMLIHAYAKRDIEKGAELTIDYVRDIWFKPLRWNVVAHYRRTDV